jgi:hypothetical protein
MIAKEKSLTFIASISGSIKIPFFQREYVWDESNWEELLQNLFSHPSTSHFIGSIILKPQKTITGSPTETLVIDGQQRLTTLSLLLKAFYCVFPKDIRDNCKDILNSSLFFKPNITKDKRLVKIVHSRLDAKDYTKIIDCAIENIDLVLDTVTKESSKIFRCFKYFVDSLKKTQDQLPALFESLLDDKNKMLVVIDLEENDNEQAIFDTINSAGIRLSSADIIKNALFQRAISIFNDESDVIALYKEYWERVFCSDTDTKDFWGSERLTGRIKRDNIEILLHAVAVIKQIFDPDKHTLSDLSDLYKNFINGLQTATDIKNFLQILCDYAQLYRDNIIAFDKSTLLSFNDGVKRLLHILDTLELSTFFPYILYALKEKSENDYLHQFVNLEKFVLKRAIMRDETKSYNKLCKDLLVNDAILQDKNQTIEPENVGQGLHRINNKIATLLLFWIELYRRSNNSKYDEKELKYSYSLEHIMPQKWVTHWSEIPQKNNPDGEIMTDEEAKKDRQEKIYWLGNMTLLTTALNSSLKNYPFKTKVSGIDAKRKGMKEYSKLSVANEIISSEKETWCEDDIISRTNGLCQEILTIWG